MADTYLLVLSFQLECLQHLGDFWELLLPPVHLFHHLFITFPPRVSLFFVYDYIDMNTTLFFKFWNSNK